MCACVRVCVCACVCACVRACVPVCVCVGGSSVCVCGGINTHPSPPAPPQPTSTTPAHVKVNSPPTRHSMPYADVRCVCPPPPPCPSVPALPVQDGTVPGEPGVPGVSRRYTVGGFGVLGLGGIRVHMFMVLGAWWPLVTNP